jgi:hypothetical protein
MYAALLSVETQRWVCVVILELSIEAILGPYYFVNCMCIVVRKLIYICMRSSNSQLTIYVKFSLDKLVNSTNA